VSSDNVPEHDKGAGNAEQPTDNEHGQAAVRAEFHRFVEAYEADTEHRRAADESKHHWEKWTTIGVWLYTILTAAITGTAIHQVRLSERSADAAQTAANAAKSSAEANVGQLTEMKNAGRAWVSPITMQLDRPLSAGFPLMFHLVIQNSGREPALAFAIRLVPNVISNIPPITDWDSAAFPKNQTCDSLYPVDGGGVVYPGAGAITRSDALRDIGMNRLAFAATVNQTSIFYIEGCIAYLTLGKPHKSGFCYFLKPPFESSGAGLDFKICPTGNQAD